jgi:hypothetical protein
MRCKIAITQKFMWRYIMRSTKSKKVSILHYSIDMDIYIYIYIYIYMFFFFFLNLFHFYMLFLSFGTIQLLIGIKIRYPINNRSEHQFLDRRKSHDFTSQDIIGFITITTLPD